MIGHFDVRNNYLGGAILAGLFILIWMSFFPAWRMLARRRLFERVSPLWWADIPGAAWLGWILITVSLYVVYTELVQSNQLSRSAELWIGIIVLGATLIPAVSYLTVCINCLLPDRRIPDEEIFD